MHNPWLAGGGGERADRARRVARAHAGFLAGESPDSPGLRDVVAASWRRAAGAKVDPDAGPPVVLADGDLDAYRDAHPLASVIGVLRELVGGVAEDGQHLMAVGDAAGQLLWVEGHRGTRRRAEAMNFVEGAVWNEQRAGTNAPGTALAIGRPVQIFSTEHFLHAVQRWTCAAAPIRNPATGQVLGVIDVTGGDPVAHPHSLALVRSAVRPAAARGCCRSGPSGSASRTSRCGSGSPPCCPPGPGSGPAPRSGPGNCGRSTACPPMLRSRNVAASSVASNRTAAQVAGGLPDSRRSP